MSSPHIFFFGWGDVVFEHVDFDDFFFRLKLVVVFSDEFCFLGSFFWGCILLSGS